jgi:hypothetical protein
MQYFLDKTPSSKDLTVTLVSCRRTIANSFILQFFRKVAGIALLIAYTILVVFVFVVSND